MDSPCHVPLRHGNRGEEPLSCDNRCLLTPSIAPPLAHPDHSTAAVASGSIPGPPATASSIFSPLPPPRCRVRAAASPSRPGLWPHPPASLGRASSASCDSPPHPPSPCCTVTCRLRTPIHRYYTAKSWRANTLCRASSLYRWGMHRGLACSVQDGAGANGEDQGKS